MATSKRKGVSRSPLDDGQPTYQHSTKIFRGGSNDEVRKRLKEGSADGSEIGNESDSENEMLAREIFVNMAQASEVEEFCRSNDVVLAAVDFLINYIRANGLTILLRLGGFPVTLNAEMQAVFDVEWSGTLLDEMIWDFLLTGFTVTNLVDSNVKEGEKVPMCINRACYGASFVQYFGKRREYRIYPMRANMAAEMFRKKQDPSKQIRADERVKVYVLYPPRSNGALTSPLSTLLDKLQTSAWSWTNFAAADYSNTHPTWAIENVVPSGHEPDPIEEAEGGEATLGLVIEKTTQKGDDLQIQRMRERFDAAAVLLKMQNEQYAKAVKTVRPNPHAQMAAYGSAVILPPNFRPVNTQEAKYNPSMEELERMVASAVARVLGVPAQMFAGDSVVHAANADMDMSSLNRTITGWHRRLTPILKELYTDAYHAAHGDMVETVAEIVAENVAWRASRARPAEYISTHGQPGSVSHKKSKGDSDREEESDDGDDDDEDSDTKQKKPAGKPAPPKSETTKLIAASKILGTSVTRVPSFEASLKPAIILSDEQLKELVELGVQFDISFRNALVANLETIFQIYDKDIINYDQMASRVGSILGIDKSCLLSAEQSEAQKEHRAKVANEHAEKFPLAAPDGAGGYKAAAKPAAAKPGGAAAGKAKTGASKK